MSIDGKHAQHVSYYNINIIFLIVVICLGVPSVREIP